MSSRCPPILLRLDLKKKNLVQTFSLFWWRSSVLNQIIISSCIFNYFKIFKVWLAEYSSQVFNNVLYLTLFSWRSIRFFSKRLRRSQWRLRLKMKLKKFKKYKKFKFIFKKSRRYSRIYGLKYSWKVYNVIRLNAIQLKLFFRNFLNFFSFNNKKKSSFFLKKKKIKFLNSFKPFYKFYFKLCNSAFKKNLFLNESIVTSNVIAKKKIWYLKLFWKLYTSSYISQLLKILTYCSFFDVAKLWKVHFYPQYSGSKNKWNPYFFKISLKSNSSLLKKSYNAFITKNFIMVFYFSYLTRNLNSMVNYFRFMFTRWNKKRQGFLFRFFKLVLEENILKIFLPKIDDLVIFPWIYIKFSGRINGKHRSRTFKFGHVNSKPAGQNLARTVDFYKTLITTPWGAYGLKLWSYFDPNQFVESKKLKFFSVMDTFNSFLNK